MSCCRTLSREPSPGASIESDFLADALMTVLELDGHYYGLAQSALGGHRVVGGVKDDDLEATRENLAALHRLASDDDRARDLGIAILDACIRIRDALAPRVSGQGLVDVDRRGPSVITGPGFGL